MPPRAAVVEEFDDDTDLPLPDRPTLPNTGTRGPILQSIDSDPDDDEEEDDSEDDDAGGQPRPGPASPSQRGGFGSQQRAGTAGDRDKDPPTVSDLTPYKKWTAIYPIYLDAKRPLRTGARRIARPKALWYPLSKDIADAASRLGLSTLHEVNKTHPADWDNPGRVRVQWKREGGGVVNPQIKTKKKLIEMVSFHIQSLKPELIPRPPFTTGASMTEAQLPPKATSQAKGKQVSKSASSSKAAAKPANYPLSEYRSINSRLPQPPSPPPPMATRVSPYSPALPTGVLIETVKAGMSAESGGQAGGMPPPGAGVGGKGKRKIIRARG